jgi:hypothetical protein
MRQGHGICFAPLSRRADLSPSLLSGLPSHLVELYLENDASASRSSGTVASVMRWVFAVQRSAL